MLTGAFGLRRGGTVSNFRLWPLCSITILWVCFGDFRGASALWCGTRVGSDPQRGQPDEVMAPNGCAQFLAAGLEPAQLLPRSVEENKKQMLKHF